MIILNTSKKGNNQIPRSREAIINLKKRGVPVSLITNGGGELESVRGNKISEILKLEEKYKFKMPAKKTTPVAKAVPKKVE